MVLLAEDAVDLIEIFDPVDVGQAAARQVLGLSTKIELVEPPAVQKAVACRQIDREGRRVREARLVTGHECREQEPKAGDGHSKGVHVHAIDTVERLLGEVTEVARRLVARPDIEEPLEGAQKKVPRAGRSGR